MEVLIQYSSHFHARGVNRRRGSMSLQNNTLDWKRVFRMMRRMGYKGWIELEHGGNNVTDTVMLRDYLRTLAAPTRTRRRRHARFCALVSAT